MDFTQETKFFNSRSYLVAAQSVPAANFNHFIMNSAIPVPTTVQSHY
jgi:hypothetical protein